MLNSMWLCRSSINWNITKIRSQIVNGAVSTFLWLQFKIAHLDFSSRLHIYPFSMNASSHLKCIFISDLLLNVFVDWILLFFFERLWSRTQQKQWRTLECLILSIRYVCTQNLALDSLFLIYIGALHLLVSKGKAICTSCHQII